MLCQTFWTTKNFKYRKLNHKETFHNISRRRAEYSDCWWKWNLYKLNLRWWCYCLTSLGYLSYRILYSRLIWRHRSLDIWLSPNIHFINWRIRSHWKNINWNMCLHSFLRPLLWPNWLTFVPEIDDGGWVSCAIRALPWVVVTCWFCCCKYGLGCCAGGGIVQCGDVRLTCPWKKVLSERLKQIDNMTLKTYLHITKKIHL